MQDFISDELYHKISIIAYQNYISVGSVISEDAKYKDWKAVEPEGLKMR